MVERLRQASGGIERSLAAITQVTSQTRRLALNATVEGLAQMAVRLHTDTSRLAEANP